MSSVTIHDIARLVKLNPSTVSRALRNDPRVKEATRIRIQTIAAEHHYVPNLNARNLADGKTRRIALLMNSLYSDIEIEPAAEINRILAEHGYTTMILLCSGSKELFLRHLDHLAQKLSDAALILPPCGENDEDSLKKLTALKSPVIFIDRWPKKSLFPTVTTDHAEAIRQLFQCAAKEDFDAVYVDMGETNSASASRRKALIHELNMHKKIYFTQPEQLQEYLLKNRMQTLCIFSNGTQNSEFLNDLFEGVSERPEKIISCSFDNPGMERGDCFDKLFLCIQDFKKIAAISSELLLQLLEGEKPKEILIQVPPLEIRSILPRKQTCKNSDEGF